MTLFISADHIHVDQKAICIVSYSVYYPAACILDSIYCLGSFCLTGVSGSCVIPSLARSASPLIPGGILSRLLFSRFI